MTQNISVDERGLKKKIAKLGASLQAKMLLRAVGLKFLRWIDQNFREEGKERPWAPLSPNTVAGRRKGSGSGSAQILQDTGRLKQSFSILRSDENTVTVGTNLSYAKYHHYGTDPYTIEPKSSRILAFVTADGMRFSKTVNHPGLPSRPLIPSEKLSKKIARETVEQIINEKLKRM